MFQLAAGLKALDLQLNKNKTMQFARLYCYIQVYKTSKIKPAQHEIPAFVSFSKEIIRFARAIGHILTKKRCFGPHPATIIYLFARIQAPATRISTITTRNSTFPRTKTLFSRYKYRTPGYFLLSQADIQLFTPFPGRYSIICPTILFLWAFQY